MVSFASIFAATPGSSLPSWVPDWRARIQPLVVPLMASQNATDFLGNLRPLRLLANGNVTARYTAPGSKAPVYTFQGSTLNARG
jgi:hypothetical protein